MQSATYRSPGQTLYQTWSHTSVEEQAQLWLSWSKQEKEIFLEEVQKQLDIREAAIEKKNRQENRKGPDVAAASNWQRMLVGQVDPEPNLEPRGPAPSLMDKMAREMKKYQNDRGAPVATIPRPTQIRNALSSELAHMRPNPQPGCSYFIDYTSPSSYWWVEMRRLFQPIPQERHIDSLLTELFPAGSTEAIAWYNALTDQRYKQFDAGMRAAAERARRDGGQLAITLENPRYTLNPKRTRDYISLWTPAYLAEAAWERAKWRVYGCQMLIQQRRQYRQIQKQYDETKLSDYYNLMNTAQVWSHKSLALLDAYKEAEALYKEASDRIQFWQVHSERVELVDQQLLKSVLLDLEKKELAYRGTGKPKGYLTAVQLWEQKVRKEKD